MGGGGRLNIENLFLSMLFVMIPFLSFLSIYFMNLACIAFILLPSLLLQKACLIAISMASA